MPEENVSPSTAALKELQKGVASRVVTLSLMLEELSSQLDRIEHIVSTASHLSAEEATKHLQESRTAPIGGAQLTPEEIAELSVLMQPPGYSRPQWHPKRWLAQVYRFLFGRQYVWNERVTAHLHRLSWHLGRREEFSATLMEYIFFIAQNHSQALHEIIAFERQATRWWLAMTPLLFSKSPALSGEPAPTESPSSQRQSDWEELRRLAAGYEEKLAQVEAKLMEVKALRENWSLAANDLTALRLEMAQLLESWKQEIQELRALGERGLGGGDTPQTQEPSSASPEPGAPEPSRGTLPYSFLDFERALRGGEIQIAAEQARYVEWFRDCAPVLDVGCGRGEFLELLRAQGIAAHGIDRDSAMVAYCRAKGLDVSQAELESYFEGLPDEFLGGIFMGHVIEHLDQPLVLRLPQLLWRKLKPGGSIVIETINPMCLSTFSGAMYADPTHVRPVHPQGLEFLLRNAGFADATLILSAPIPESNKLAPLKEKAPLDPIVKDLVLQMNANIERLNTLLYSYANYALAARKPR